MIDIRLNFLAITGAELLLISRPSNATLGYNTLVAISMSICCVCVMPLLVAQIETSMPVPPDRQSTQGGMCYTEDARENNCLLRPLLYAP